MINQNLSNISLVIIAAATSFPTAQSSFLRSSTRSLASPVNELSLTSGRATVTYYAQGETKCGSPGTEGQYDRPDGWVLAAAPWSIFKEFNDGGVPGLDLNYGGTTQCNENNCVVEEIDSHEQLCFELYKTDGDNETHLFNAFVADVCAGSCPKADGLTSCSSDYSCLDRKDLYKKKENRCPPVDKIYSTAHDGTQQLLDETNELIPWWIYTAKHVNADDSIQVEDYPSVKYTDHGDWCSGDNMHFDIQDDDLYKQAFSDNNPHVVHYRRISCPDSLNACAN